jgi:hypothetical protein
MNLTEAGLIFMHPPKKTLILAMVEGIPRRG